MKRISVIILAICMFGYPLLRVATAFTAEPIAFTNTIHDGSDIFVSSYLFSTVKTVMDTLTSRADSATRINNATPTSSDQEIVAFVMPTGPMMRPLGVSVPQTIGGYNAVTTASEPLNTDGGKRCCPEPFVFLFFFLLYAIALMPRGSIDDHRLLLYTNI